MAYDSNRFAPLNCLAFLTQDCRLDRYRPTELPILNQTYRFVRNNFIWTLIQQVHYDDPIGAGRVCVAYPIKYPSYACPQHMAWKQ